ncbi:efflux RND transporter periplasmic adaptor subunit [Robertkochia aurantiaca]|uniref:efflux RND transporter periplasmic adaptor subunit n=1 Tax=Robertkochia aurantiaca TaxID=2873700 RepID=UPI001CCB970A|nr:efflux RND transporter periplasmic adaptor subunit [Robertkochia sp. 3YJGBD-33]
MDIPLERKSSKFPFWLKITVSVLVVVLIIFVLTSSGGDRTLTIEKERLTLAEVSHGSFQENIAVSGLVMPISSIYLDALEGGRVEEKYVEDGAVLKKGDPILRLSNTDLELSLINQETAVYNLLTQMQISQNAARQNSISRLNQMTDVENAYIEAERIYNLNKSLFKKGVIARQDLIQSENNFNYQKERKVLTEAILKEDSLANKHVQQQEKSSYERTRKALELMRKKVNDLLVIAPVDGQLTALDAEIGETKTKGERLGQIDVLSGYKVRAEIDEHYITRIMPGQTGRFTFSGIPYELVIKKVYAQVTNGRFQVDMNFVDSIPENIKRGQSLQVKLALSAEKEALRLPKGAFYQSTGGSWIFKLSEDGNSAYRTTINLGSQNGEYFEVLSGLQPGDRVITSGYDRYKNIEELTLIH